jgi:UDP-3-O-[3-hydroxymyristoyl] glucosamine N-acyltransferase
VKLSEISFGQSLVVARDGAFSSLGFVNQRRPGMLTFLASEEFSADVLGNDAVSCVLATRELAESVPDNIGLAVCDDPRLTFYHLHNHLATATHFYRTRVKGRISLSARVHPTAFVASDVEIEDEVEVGPHAVILPGTSVGAGSVIRAGSVIGSEGFQVIHREHEVLRVVHAGTVRIGRKVEIHANCCVDRGLFGETTVGDESTIDSLVYVAHEVRVGERCRIGAHAVVNGSAVIEDDAWIGPGAVLSNGISVGSRATVTMGAVVTRDVPPAARVSGNFAIDHERFLAFIRSIRQ